MKRQRERLKKRGELWLWGRFLQCIKGEICLKLGVIKKIKKKPSRSDQ